MAGPNLELFKFAIYVFFPVAMMFHYGNPEWYEKHVLPLKDTFWPKEENTHKPPYDKAGIQAEIEKFRAERLARKQQQQQQQRQQQQQYQQGGDQAQTGGPSTPAGAGASEPRRLV